MKGGKQMEQATVEKEHQIFQLQRLLTQPPDGSRSVSQAQLLEAIMYMQPHHYEDIVVERAVMKICGWPLCENDLSRKLPHYRISRKEGKVYDQTYRKNFCSEKCFNASSYLEVQISSESILVRGHESVPKPTLIWNANKELPSKIKIIERETELGEPLMDFDTEGDNFDIIEDLSIQFSGVNIRSAMPIKAKFMENIPDNVVEKTVYVMPEVQIKRENIKDPDKLKMKLEDIKHSRKKTKIIDHVPSRKRITEPISEYFDFDRETESGLSFFSQLLKFCFSIVTENTYVHLNNINLGFENVEIDENNMQYMEDTDQLPNIILPTIDGLTREKSRLTVFCTIVAPRFNEFVKVFGLRRMDFEFRMYVNTLSFHEAIPSFNKYQWKIVALIILYNITREYINVNKLEEILAACGLPLDRFKYLASVLSGEDFEEIYQI
eukprot:TRINITY_DN2796_c0_g2_i1.p2 TRINITY_DN2796_c0_g2~~TRINITY_DN2796_c0_g2_i1.p2  ORF type:complete len:503 (+),score=109.72 TRINITY_DN2796_c0_g2_i1:201-1511(+)